MGILPIPAKLFFEDFSSDLITYEIFNSQEQTGVFQGIENSDESGRHIGFLVEDKPNIQIGNTITTQDKLNKYTVKNVEYERFAGKPELLKAYY
ncbi:MAG: hypothetical protein EOM28_09500 [Clostridia bacterium]|nr:hypothetical protein [Clostridia bacterium]